MAYDAVIIGAGHNGLAAGVHLAARGKRVAIVEAKEEPGGAVKTRDLTLPGFRHDLCAMNFSMFAGSGFFAAHKDALQAHGLAFVPAEHAFATVFRDGTYLGVSRTLEKTLTGISALSPADAQAWADLLARFGGDAPHIFALLGSPMPSIAAARVVWKAWRAMGTNRLVDTVKLLLASPRDFLDARFEHPKVKTMMAAWGLHLDFSPDVAGGALFPYLESMANQSLGMVIGQGGADTIVKAMVGALKAKGGELILGDGGSRIDLANGAASGVTLQSGRKLEAGTIIANVHPKIVFEELTPPDATPASFRGAVKSFRAGPATMMIHLALNDLPDWRAGGALREFAYVHVAPDMEMMTRVYAEAAAGLLPAEPVLVVGQPTAIDSSRAPAGKHVLWVQVRVLPAEIRRRRRRDHRRPWLGRGPRALWGPRAGHSRDLRAGAEKPRARPGGLLAARSRAGESEPDRRRQPVRQPSPRPEFLPASRRWLVALSDAGQEPLSVRRVHLAGSRHRRGLGLHGRENARGLSPRIHSGMTACA